MSATVLVVDDSESAREAMRNILERADLGLRIVEAVDGATALPLALSGDVDIVVSDIIMPTLDGIGLLRGIRQQKDFESLPVILITTSTDGETRELSFEVGANDYLTKPYSPIELVSRVQVQMRLKALQAELRSAQERHKKLGLHDELTGLANRKHLYEACRRELARSRRHKFSMSLLLVDADDFGALNRKVGHLVGDAIITELAEVLQRDLRAPDILARLGGAKFGLLLPQTDARQAMLVGERLHAAVELHPFPGITEPLGLSIGVATYPTGRLESADEIINAAGASLDRVKEAGGRRVLAWTESEVLPR